MHTGVMMWVDCMLVESTYSDHAFLHQPAQAHDFGSSSSRSEEESYNPVEGFR